MIFLWNVYIILLEVLFLIDYENNLQKIFPSWPQDSFNDTSDNS